MKKITIVSVLSFIFLITCSFVEYLLRNYEFEKSITPLLFGFLILAISGIVSLIAKKDLYLNIICFLLNSIALGFCLRSWYMFRSFDNPFWIVVLISLACVIYLLIFYFLLYIPFFDKHFKAYIWTFIITTFVVYLIVMIFTKTTFVSTFGYFVIIEISFIFSMCKRNDSFVELFRNIALSSFCVLIIAIIMLLLMLECDGIDGFDFGGEMIDFNSPKEKKNNNYNL